MPIYLHNHNKVLDVAGLLLFQLIFAKSDLSDCFNIRTCTDAIYTDLSEAFDSISYYKLLLKMHGYSINLSI